MSTKKKVMLSQAQINKMHSDIAGEAAENAFLIFLVAAKDELGLGETRLVRIIERIDRYCDHIESHAVRLKEVKQIMEKNTGLQFKGF